MKSFSSFLALTLFAVAMTVTAQKDSPSSPQGGDTTNQMKNVEWKMKNGGSGSTATSNILHSSFSILHFSRSSFPILHSLPVSDADISNGWSVVSVSSNALDAAVFAMPSGATVWETARDCGAGYGHWRVPADGWRFPFGPSLWTNGFLWVEGAV